MHDYQKASPNFTQRNNPTHPERACNVSATVTAAVAAGWNMPDGPTEQADENFMLFIQGSKECNDLAAQLNESWGTTGKDFVPPEQCFTVLDLALNLWLKANAVYSLQAASPQRIMAHLDAGGACFASGLIPPTKGHYIAIVSYEPAGIEKAIPTSWLIKDPWGDYTTKYKVHYGNNIIMPYADYLRYMRPAGQTQKAMHFVRQNPNIRK